MEWLSRRLDQKDRNQDAFRRAAGHLFTQLKEFIDDALAIYNRRSGRPITELAYIQNNSVRFGTAPDAAGNRTQAPNTPNINLTLGATMITADYSSGAPPVLFPIDTDEKGYVRLKQGNDVISLDKATEIILSDFLFS